MCIRDRDKLEKNLGGIKDMKRIPDAIFIVDPKTVSYTHLNAIVDEKDNT